MNWIVLLVGFLFVAVSHLAPATVFAFFLDGQQTQRREIKSSQSLPRSICGEDRFLEVPDFAGAPEEIRTPDPQIRSLVLYPAELRAQIPLPETGPRKSGIAIGLTSHWQGLSKG
jgi:hypothetical protein